MHSHGWDEIEYMYNYSRFYSVLLLSEFLRVNGLLVGQTSMSKKIKDEVQMVMRDSRIFFV